MSFNVCFFQGDLKPADLLKTFRKMTPGGTGVWKDMIGVPNPVLADYFVVIDYTTIQHEKFLVPERTIYLGAHPTSCEGYHCFDGKSALSKFDCRDTFGFGEWWINFDYDYLTNLLPMDKTVNLSSIISNQRYYDYHQRRVEFLKEYCTRYPSTINIHGRWSCAPGEEEIQKHYKGVCGVPDYAPNYLNSYWGGKEGVLSNSRYVLEFDMGASPKQGKCENYFSERLFDDMLLWCMPLYYGGTNLEKYLPRESFEYVDIFNDQNAAHSIFAISNSNLRERNLRAIAEARDLLLNKYQIWPRVYDAIKGVK